LKILTYKNALTKMQAVILVAVIVAAAVAGVAYYLLSNPSEPTTTEPIKIGASVAQTGSLGPNGQKIKDAYLFWAEECNKRGGLLGRNVTMVIYDDGGDPTTTASIYERLITVDKVDLIFGPYSSACSFAMAPIAEKYQMVNLQPCSDQLKLYQQGWEYTMFSVVSGPPTSQYLWMIGGTIDSLGSDKPTTLAILNADTMHGVGVADAVTEACGKLNIEVVRHETFVSGTLDITANLLNIKDADPDILVAVGDFTDEIMILKTADEQNFHPKMWIGETAFSNFKDAHTQLGDAADYVIGVTYWDKRYANTASSSFVAAYRAKYGTDPNIYNAFGFNVGQFVEEAVNGAGTLDQNEIRDYILTHPIDTLMGTWNVDQDLVAEGIKYMPVSQLRIGQIQNGDQEIILPAVDATSEFVYPRP
jgi:branched-chain amino acid transport system substrate-binding protein